MRDLIAAIERARDKTSDKYRVEAVQRQHERGKLTARERIDLLCDPGTFREMGRLVEPARDNEFNMAIQAPADAVVTGWGLSQGRPIMVAASDYTVMGGSTGAIGRQKIVRSAKRAGEAGMPFIMLHDGGGHRIQDGQDARSFAYGTPIFNVLAQLSGWVPIIAGIMGPAFAGPTQYSALADLVVMIRGRSAMGMAGPALVKAAIGEDISIEELGGAKMHSDISGIAHLAVDDEQSCIKAIKDYLSYLPSNAQQSLPILDVGDSRERRDEALLDIVPTNTRQVYDVNKVIDHVVDKKSRFDIQPTYARNLATCFARLDGKPVGIIANQPKHQGGMLDTKACEKGAHFIAVCDAFGLPLIYLMDVPGSAIGSVAERTGLGRRNGRMLYELGCSTVPRITVVLRKGYGGGYVVMNGGTSFESDASLIWPTAEICAMSIEGSVDVAFRRDYESAADPAARRSELIAKIRSQTGPLRAAEHFYIDDVIDPRDTRSWLIDILRVAQPRRRSSPHPRYRSISPV